MQFSHQTWPYPDAQTHPSLIKIIFPRLFEETTLLCTLHSPIPFPTFPPIPQQKKKNVTANLPLRRRRRPPALPPKCALNPIAFRLQETTLFRPGPEPEPERAGYCPHRRPDPAETGSNLHSLLRPRDPSLRSKLRSRNCQMHHRKLFQSTT